MGLRGKVAAILADDSVIINLGSTQGVKPGMRFQAVFEAGDIHDPDDSSRILGDLTYEIGKLEATNVMDYMSICKIPVVLGFAAKEGSTLLRSTTSRIDPKAPRLFNASDAKIKVGTVVIEMSPEPSKGGFTPPPPSAQGSSR